MNTDELVRRVTARFGESGIVPRTVDVRTYPGETIVVVEVDRDFDRATAIGRTLDAEIEAGFVTIRQFKASTVALPPVSGVHDGRVATLIELLNSRERTSESQPSLRYISDAGERLNLAIAPRHHLVFGRRGVGKTALLLEARRIVASQGAATLWVNMHPLRELSGDVAFLTISHRLCELGSSSIYADKLDLPSRVLLGDLKSQLEEVLFQQQAKGKQAKGHAYVPRLQQAISRLCLATKQPVYIFLDDVHYLDPKDVPGLLDQLHGVSRDNPMWLKVAGIRHQTRWFTPHPPIGLQTRQDASIINLDVTLEEPARARQFLQDVLRSFVDECHASPERHFLGSGAIDRLVLASGGVPRDFLSLCAAALQIARHRSSARTLGVQDVNNAAGGAAQTKLQELEDDAAAARGSSRALVAALNAVRHFLLNVKQITFLRIDFLDKEKHPTEYRLMQALMDLRMLHLVHSSVSDNHHAGRRSEVYLLDLSQYSGTRLKQKLQVLDFERDHLVLKTTRSNESPRLGNTPRRLIELLRRGPQFQLRELAGQIEMAEDGPTSKAKLKP